MLRGRTRREHEASHGYSEITTNHSSHTTSSEFRSNLHSQGGMVRAAWSGRGCKSEGEMRKHTPPHTHTHKHTQTHTHTTHTGAQRGRLLLTHTPGQSSGDGRGIIYLACTCALPRAT